MCLHLPAFAITLGVSLAKMAKLKPIVLCGEPSNRNCRKKSEQMQSAIDIAKDRLGMINILEYRENEEGRSARGKCICPECKKVVPFSACSDVGGVWVFCPIDGMLDY